MRSGPFNASVGEEEAMKVQFRPGRPSFVRALMVMAILFLPAFALAAPKADHVSPQRLTVFVGSGEYRVRIEGKNLREVDEAVAIDASKTGFVFEVPEVEARILHAENDVMIVLLKATSHPERDDFLQIEFIYGHQKYRVPAGLFQFNVQ